MFAIIMAGGSGTRFWPAGRESLPKQFLPILGRLTMFEETLNRVSPLVEDRNVLTVVNRVHRELVERIVGERPVRVLVEPVGRNTAACIGLAAIHVRRRSADEPMIVLPSDQFIGDVEQFRRSLAAACEAAREGALVTLGIQPTRPETGYGYIEVGVETGEFDDQACRAVERFVEKPDAETALKYLTSGRYVWNSGIFIFTARVILNEIRKYLPRLSEALERIDQALDGPESDDVLEREYRALESVSIDYGVMEKTEAPVRVFRTDFGWSDVGSWQALHELRGTEADGNGNLLLGDVLTLDAKSNLVLSQTDRVTALLGVEGLVVVDTADALLIADRSRSQDVKHFPAMLRKQNRSDLC